MVLVNDMVWNSVVWMTHCWLKVSTGDNLIIYYRLIPSIQAVSFGQSVNKLSLATKPLGCDTSGDSARYCLDCLVPFQDAHSLLVPMNDFQVHTATRTTTLVSVGALSKLFRVGIG